jgi:ABC-2 type transport system permease protein
MSFPVLLVTAWEFRRRVTTRGFWLATLLLPLFPALLIGLVALVAVLGRAQTETWEGVALYDATRLIEPEAFPKTLRWTADSLTFQQWLEELRQQRLRWLIVLTDSGLQRGSLTVYGRRGEFPQTLRKELEQVLLRHYASRAGLDSLTKRLLVEGLRWNIQYGEASGIAGNPLTGTGAAFFVTVLLFALLTTYGGTLTDSVAEEKEDKLAELLLGAVRPQELLWGKVLGLGAVGIFQLVCWALLFSLLAALFAPALVGLAATDLGATVQERLLPALQQSIEAAVRKVAGWVVLCFVLGYLLYAGLFAAAGALAQSRSQAGVPLLIVLTPLSLPLLLMPVLMEAPNGPVGIALSLFPFTAPAVLPLRVLLEGIPWWQAALSVVGMLATAGGIFWLAGKLYRVGLLLPSGLPSWKQLWQWLRSAG